MYLQNVSTPVMITRVKKWGNSLAIRLTKRDLEELGVAEGDTVKVEIERLVPDEEVDLSEAPTFEDPDELVSERHDRYLYGEE